MWKARAQLFGTVSVGALAIAGLHRVPSRVPVDWNDPIVWLNRSPIEDVITEAIRLVALGLSYWFVISTVLYFLAVVFRLPAAMRAVEWATLPAMRSISRRVAAVTLATSMAAPAAMLLIPPAPEATGTGPVGAEASSDLSIPLDTSGSQPLIRLTDDGVVVPPGYQQPSEPAYEPTVGTPGPAPTPSNDVGASTVDRTDDSSHRAASHIVVDGDNLWSISKDHLAKTSGIVPSNAEIVPYWNRVIDLNLPNLRSGDPDMIYPGEVVALPPYEGTDS